VGANAVVPNRMVVPAGSLAIGVPAVIKPGKSSLRLIQLSSAEYVKNGQHYKKELTRID
jgi:carbonic anhydrase/acetyltransferase-like protein (isoleucine patch superfamily)